jgi:hypothetical protein
LPWTMTGALWVFALANLYFGLNSELSLGLSSMAVFQLMGMGVGS